MRLIVVSGARSRLPPYNRERKSMSNKWQWVRVPDCETTASEPGQPWERSVKYSLERLTGWSPAHWPVGPVVH